MSVAIRLMAEPVREVAFGVITPTFSTLGDPLDNAIRILVLQNTTNTGVMLSFDGVTDHLPVVTNGYLTLDIAGNKTNSRGFFLAEGQQIYVRQLGAAPTSGSVYLSVFYGAEI